VGHRTHTIELQVLALQIRSKMCMPHLKVQATLISHFNLHCLETYFSGVWRPPFALHGLPRVCVRKGGSSVGAGGSSPLLAAGQGRPSPFTSKLLKAHRFWPHHSAPRCRGSSAARHVAAGATARARFSSAQVCARAAARLQRLTAGSG
jgi:hypothetical protein